MPRPSRPKATFSIAVRHGIMPSRANMSPTSWRMPVTGRPSTSTLSRLGGIRPETMLRIVDLPQPEGPTMVTIEPSGTSKVKSRTATTGSRSRGRNTMPTSARRIFAGGPDMVAGSGTGERRFTAKEPRLDLAHDQAEQPGDHGERDQPGKHARGVEARRTRGNKIAQAVIGRENLRHDH